MKVTYKTYVRISPFAVLEKYESFHAVSKWKPEGTSLVYFRTDRFNIRTVAESDIVSIEGGEG